MLISVFDNFNEQAMLIVFETKCVNFVAKLLFLFVSSIKKCLLIVMNNYLDFDLVL